MIFLFDNHKSFFIKYEEETFFFRGEFFFAGNRYTYKDAEKVKALLNEVDDIVSLISGFNGNFLLGIKKRSKLFFFQDKIMSFPMFYAIDENNSIRALGDNAEKLYKNYGLGKLSEKGRSEIIGFGYTLGNETIYKGIKLLGPGEYIKIDLENNEFDQITYYRHLHRELGGVSEDDWLKKLDDVVQRTFDRLVERLNGRQAVLFISGGYDSRLVILELYKRKYRNLICISLTASGELDETVGQSVARELGYECLKFDYSSRFWRERREETGFWETVWRLSNGITLPYYLQGYVVDLLVKKGDIARDAVILTGNSGDVVEGEDVSLFFQEGEKYSEQEIAEFIFFRFFCNYSNDVVLKQVITEEIIRRFPYHNRDGFSFVEAEDLYEYFNWYERQCKYVTSDVRNYDDLSGNEWALPLWDDAFVQFWLDVPLEHRYKRNLYYKYVKNDNLPTANVTSLFMRFREWLIRNPDCFLMPVAYLCRRIIGRYGNSLDYVLGGLLSEMEWWEITKETFSARTTSVNDISIKLLKMAERIL